jgi:hypothetical protein
MSNRDIRRIRHQNAELARKSLRENWPFGSSLVFRQKEQRCTELLKETER